LALAALGARGALAVADPRFDQPLSGLYWQVHAGDALLRSPSLWDGVLPLQGNELADGAVHRHRISGSAEAELLALERSFRLLALPGNVSIRAAVGNDTREVAAATRAFAAIYRLTFVSLGQFSSRPPMHRSLSR